MFAGIHKVLYGAALSYHQGVAGDIHETVPLITQTAVQNIMLTAIDFLIHEHHRIR